MFSNELKRDPPRNLSRESGRESYTDNLRQTISMSVLACTVHGRLSPVLDLDEGKQSARKTKTTRIFDCSGRHRVKLPIGHFGLTWLKIVLLL